MTQLLDIDSERRDEILTCAAERQVLVVLSHRLDGGWLTAKSRLLAADSTGRFLVLEQPLPAPGHSPPELAPGEWIGLSFRRGHKKCMCSVPVEKLCRYEAPEGMACPALQVPWPDRLQEMQRRLYYRTVVPHGRRIEVRIWDGRIMDRSTADLQHRPHHLGLLQDVSAGGCRVVFAANRDPELEAGDTVGVQFQADPRSTPLRIDAMYRHCEPLPSGKLSLGFQFVGLEMTPQGQSTLQALSRVVSTFLRIQIRRRNQRNSHGPRRRQPAEGEPATRRRRRG